MSGFCTFDRAEGQEGGMSDGWNCWRTAGNKTPRGHEWATCSRGRREMGEGFTWAGSRLPANLSCRQTKLWRWKSGRPPWRRLGSSGWSPEAVRDQWDQARQGWKIWERLPGRQMPNSRGRWRLKRLGRATLADVFFQAGFAKEMARSSSLSALSPENNPYDRLRLVWS